MAESEEIWEKIYDVSPKLGRTVRMFVNRMYLESPTQFFDEYLVLKPTYLLNFSGMMEERAYLEGLAKESLVKYEGMLEEGNLFNGEFFKKRNGTRKIVCSFKAEKHEGGSSRLQLLEIRINTKSKKSPDILSSIIQIFGKRYYVHA